MIDLKFESTSNQTADATLRFLLYRPLMKILFIIVNISSLLLLSIFVMQIYHFNVAVRVEDISAAVMATLWLLLNKKINKSIIKLSLKMRRLKDSVHHLKFDTKSVYYKLNNLAPRNINWRSIKYAIDSDKDYIIPLAGISNTGSFIWIPKDELQKNKIHEDFIQLLEKMRVKIKCKK